jgi:predicted alpha/beta hydrolase family esterase
MKKNCIIIHGCPSKNLEKAMDPKRRTYNKHWIPWTKKELIKNGIETETPLMPDPWEPDYKKFKRELEKYKINEDTILIGTSCGCAFLVRYLGEAKKKINKLILVAPWKIQLREGSREEDFYNYLIDKKIKERVGEVIMFTADNESDGGKKSLKIFHEAIGGKIIEIEGYGHYMLKYMGTEEFPELIEAVMKNN